MEGPFLLLIRPAPSLRLGDIVKEACEANIKVPILIRRMLHGAHQMPENVIAVCLVLLNTDTPNKVRRYKFQNTELLRKDKCTHRLARIQYPHEFIPDSFT